MVLKCEVCGGELEVDESLSVGQCKFCESKIVIPKDMEKKGNLYNRAVFLRQNNEFDKAISVYEDILKDNNEEAEAHWGLVLSKYGIEYVDDPGSGEKKPTIHRIQNKSILEDADYQMAVKYADLEASYQYEKEGKRINQILTRFLEIAKKESPYDVFICYKESDDLGNRTEDSVIAQDIYRALEKEGYKVFFARKTLESKIGEEYEPIIYAALSSAKVMLVIGTKVEHYQAVWVKNEWSRFSELKQSDEKKIIIPCYKDISPYELPMEIASYQALDVSKIGFLQDLLDGVGKVLSHNKKTAMSAKERGQDVDKLCKNAETFLKLNQMGQAMSIYKSIIVSDPDDYRGWWGIASILSKSFTDYETTGIEEIKRNMNNAITVAEEDKKEELRKVYDEFVQEYGRVKREQEERRQEEERERKRIQDEEHRLKKKQELEYRKTAIECEIKNNHNHSADITNLSNSILQEKSKLKEIENRINGYKNPGDLRAKGIILLIVGGIVLGIIQIPSSGNSIFWGLFTGIGFVAIFVAPIVLIVLAIIEGCQSSSKGKDLEEKKKLELRIDELENKIGQMKKDKDKYDTFVKELQDIEQRLNIL